MAYRGDVAVDRCIEATGASAVAPASGSCPSSRWRPGPGPCPSATAARTASPARPAIADTTSSASACSCKQRRSRWRPAAVGREVAAAFSVGGCSCRPRVRTCTTTIDASRSRETKASHLPPPRAGWGQRASIGTAAERSATTRLKGVGRAQVLSLY